ncbi:MAG: DUF1761 domain-containing protein [Patescibacteria group bacterium]
MYDVNLVAVVVAVVASMAVGFAWYSPQLFGKQWMSLMGLSEDKMAAAKKEMGKMYALSFVGALIMGYVLGMVVKMAYSTTVVGGMKVGFGVWLGFIAPVQLTDTIFSGKKWNLLYLNSGYQLVSTMVMGAVLVLMG